jgi:hypothetical protein
LGLAAEAEARARTSLIEKLKITIKKLRYEQFGQSPERGALLDQLELRSDHASAGPVAADRARVRRAQVLAHILFAKYGLHLPLNRQSDVYQRGGVDLDVSTLAD